MVKVKVTILASEWGSSKGGLSTLNRELAIQLAKCPEVEITFYLPKCSQEDKEEAHQNNVKIVEAKPRPGFEHLTWLCFAPKDLQIDIIVGHGVKLGKQAQIIKEHKDCKWVQVVHTDPEELGMFKSYSNPIQRGEEKHKTEVELCEMADFVVGVGSKLSEAFRSYLCGCPKHDDVFHFTPGIFEEFADVKHSVVSVGRQLIVLLFGRGDKEDFELKGFDIAGKAVAALQDTRLVFVGASDGERQEIAQRFTECGVPANRLRVRGFIQDRESLKRLFQEVSLLVMPSRSEGFGLTGLEALSAGLPVLVSGNSGFGEALCSLPYGSLFVITSDDPADWTSAIEKICAKDWNCRLEEAETLRYSYDRKYKWKEQIEVLINKMISWVHGDFSNSQSSSKTRGCWPKASRWREGKPEPRPACLHLKICCKELVDRRPGRAVRLESRETACVSSTSNQWQHVATADPPDKMFAPVESQEEVQGAAAKRGNSGTPQVELTSCSGQEKDENGAVPSPQEILRLIAFKYLRKVDLSTPEEFNGFVRYIEKVRKALIVDVTTGSLIVKVECSSLEILEGLWEDYRTDYLNKMVQKFLVTEEILEEFGLVEVKLTTTIKKEEYRACQELLSEIAAVVEQQKGTPTASVAGNHEGESGATADNKRFGKQSNDNHSNEQGKQGYEGRGRRSSLKQEKSHVMVSKGRGKPSDAKNQDHRPPRPGITNLKPGVSQTNTRPPAQEPFRAKVASFDPKVLKEKESSQVVQVLNERLPYLKFLLRSQQQQHNSGEFIYDLTCTLARACEAPSGKNTNKIIAALKGSLFLTSKIQSVLHLVEASPSMNDQVFLHRLFQSFIVVFMKYLNHLPSSYADLPYSQLKEALGQATIDGKEKLLKDLDAFKQAREDIIRSERQTKGKRYKLGERPPNDFRMIPVCPTNKEITTQERPFLRKNISRGRYENAEHYLDVQFRLLREDFLEPLREGIHEIIRDIPRHQRKHLMKNYRSVRIIGKEFTWGGIIHQVQIDVSRIDTSRWPKSKRLLFGSFLCLSKDNFKTMLFATVSNRDEENVKEGRIDIRFIEEQDVRGIESRNHVYQMVESPAYFEAYRYVLRGLQELDEESLPFKKYLVECSAEVNPPEYLRRDETEGPVCYDLSKALDVPGVPNATAVPVLQCDAWPPVRKLPLNSSQLEALRTAITTEFSVIQGPPGTGKTYVGARIVRCLLENRQVWDPYFISPMLMVCYTNHALDQFLEKVLEFLPKDRIIRVGGRCKSEDLEDCNLKRFTYQHRLYDKRDELRYKMQAINEEMKTLKEKLAKADRQLLEFDDLEELLYRAHAQELYNTVFPTKVATVSRTPRNTFRLWLCDNKMVGSCNRTLSESVHQKRRIEDDDVSYDSSILYEPLDGRDNTQPTCVTRDSSTGVNLLPNGSPKTKDVVLKEEVPKEISDKCTLQRCLSVEHGQTLKMNQSPVNSPREAQFKVTENPRTVPELDDVTKAFEETIAIEMEADLVQHQRKMQGDEELQSPISKLQGDVLTRRREPKEQTDERWTLVTKKNGKSLPWRRREESREENATVASSNESQTKQENKKGKGKNEEKICITENISSLTEKLKMTEMMSTEEAMHVNSIWNLSPLDRLRIYLFWVESYRERYRVEIHRSEQEYEQLCEALEAVRFEEEERVIRQSTVVGMTTSGAARYHFVLQRVAPKIVVIEEAAEVMEAHIITSLSKNTKHTILIGDHKQLRPKATVYELAQKYNLEVSLFERMVINSMDCKRLSIQHRMRPEIAALTKRIYDHEITDHGSVCHFPDISGVCHNLFFIDHSQMETRIEYLQSYSNDHEADFTVALCNYLLLQGYERKKITVLTMYTGQLLLLQEKMPKRNFGGVKVCAVDNFQGEENDIILLSLVRSNEEGRIGFLGESNRICVALSRARKGFYCIGNFNLLNSHSKLWKEICDDLRTKQSIGDNLQLICKRHKAITSARWASDITLCHLGGCTMPCGDRLDCGHACDKLCHASDEYHMAGFCSKLCVNACPSNHRCQSRCHYPDKCPKCKVPVLKTPTCGHEQPVECGSDPDEVECQFECEKILECGHRCQNPCGSSCTEECKVSCKKILPCGHEKSMFCYRDPNFFQCNSRCTKLLECGHPCSKKCEESCQCNTKVEKELPCQHRIRVLCREKEFEVTCTEKCSRTLDCGHSCPGICFEDCRLKKCDINVSKHLPCGHEESAPCCQDPKTVFCYAPCPRPLDCGHKCSSICGVLCYEVQCKELCLKKCKRGHSCQKPCHFPLPCDCTEVVNSSIPTCGHSVNTPCYVDPDTLKCERSCEKVRLCGHPCKDICSNNCETRPCNVPVRRTLPCNHIVALPCHKNTKEYICKKEVEACLPCGHKTSLECRVVRAGLEHVSCKQKVERELRCRHKITLPCFKNPEECICRKKVDVELSCGHTKTVPCHTVTAGLENVRCNVKVSRMLPCNHEMTLSCHIKPEEYHCQEEIEITLSCGHNNLTKCGDSRDERQKETCNTKVTKTLPCGHEKQMKCSDKPEEVWCDAPCKRSLLCGHPCPKKCAEQCSGVKCAVEVRKALSCGYHEISCLCSKDVSQCICSNSCERNLTCGHRCPGKCSEECSQYEYKCRTIVMKTLSCSGKHSLQMLCKDDPSTRKCEERCKRNLNCGHPCPGLCSQPCGSINCTRQIEKTHPCGHKEYLKCFQSKNATCKVPCERRMKCKHKCKGVCGEPCSKYPCDVVVSKTLSCGHKVKMACSLSVDDAKCPVPCRQQLPCGHHCSGTCGDCKQKGSHEMCQNPCNRRLICSHRCRALCSEPCPPCTRNCGRRCPHKKCSQQCLEPCNPCSKPCTWICRHYACKNTCGEECDRPRCDAPCTKKLPCRHPCVGLCGENCPTVCATCHVETFSSIIGRETENAKSSRFLQLFDCGHIVKVEEMDAWMLRDWGNTAQLIHCPRCSTPITFSYRYGNIIKKTLENTEKVKAHIHQLGNETAREVRDLVEKLRRYQFDLQTMRFPKTILNGFSQSASRQPYRKPVNFHVPPIKFISLLYILRNHLIVMQQIKKEQYRLQHMILPAANSEGSATVLKQQIDNIKDVLTEMSEYLKTPELELRTLNQVYEYTWKLALFTSILEAKSMAIRRRINFSVSGQRHLKIVQEKFDSFVQGSDEALEINWLETIAPDVRKEVSLLPPSKEEPKDFENFPGFNSEIWRVCEHREVVFTKSLMRGGQNITEVHGTCKECVDFATRQEK